MRSMVESKKKYEFLLGTIKSKCALLPRLLQFDPPDLTEEERDRLELVLHSNIQWKTIALGTSAVTILIAAIFNYFTEARILWVWCAIVIFFLFCQTLLFIYLNRRPTDLRVPALWSYATLIFFSSGSIAWYSLPWWLPAEPTVLKYAGITTAAAFFFVASFNSNSYLMTAIGSTIALILIPLSAIILVNDYLVAFLLLVIFACSIGNASSAIQLKLETIRQRRRAENLSAQLLAEKAKVEAVAQERATLQERQRLMRDMHDGFGSSLAAAASLLDHGELSVQEAASLVRDCVDDLRLVLDSLEPTDSDLVALLASIRYRMVSRLEQSGLQISWGVVDLPKVDWLTPTLALHFMRIIQEAIANIIKHAAATKITVSTELVGRHIELTIKDNGCGFDPANIQYGRGLKYQRIRAQHLSAGLFVESAPGCGTTILLRFPVNP